MYTIEQLWQIYLFNKDMGDFNRANYWLKRIEEYNQTKIICDQKKKRKN